MPIKLTKPKTKAGVTEEDVNLFEEYLFQEKKTYYCFSMECTSHV